MSLPDGAEYWWDVKANHNKKHVFMHKKGLDCGHFHVLETKKTKWVDCHACLALMPKGYSCQVCRDASLTNEQFEGNNTYSWQCPSCGKMAAVIGNSKPIYK